jgi:hypothetical protein
MQNLTIIPQTRIYTIIPETNPLHELARKFPLNMCWLTALFYALQYLGFEDNKNLHYKLSYFLSSSLGLLFISKENGAMYFPKKYELTDSYVKENLNSIFKNAGIRVKVIKVLSDIKFEEIGLIQRFTSGNQELVAVVKNISLQNPSQHVLSEAPNHTVVIKKLEDLQNGRIIITYLDPADGAMHQVEVGVNVFMLWVQYIWVLERRFSLFERMWK